MTDNDVPIWTNLSDGQLYVRDPDVASSGRFRCLYWREGRAMFSDHPSEKVAQAWLDKMSDPGSGLRGQIEPVGVVEMV